MIASAKRKKTNKQPAQEKQPETSKSIHADKSLDGKNFSWSFAHADLNNNYKYGWAKVKISTLLKEIIPKLQERESAKWLDLTGKKKSHFVDTSPELGKQLDKLKMDSSLPKLFSLRLGGSKRIYGIVESSIFYILWWDPKHELYPTEKKNT